MDDARIRALYRTGAEEMFDARSADDILEVLGGRGCLVEDDAALDRVASSPLHADIARLVQGLDSEIVALAADMAHVRAPRNGVPAWRRVARRSLALAAGMGLVAVFIGIAQAPHSASDAGMNLASQPETIMSVSFEGGEVVAHQPHQDAIFHGNFDS